MSYSEQISNDDQQFEFTARISYERFYSENTSWGVYSFNTTDQLPNCQKITAHKDLFGDEHGDTFVGTLAGRMQQLCIGSEYKITATYKDDKKYGAQYVPITVYALAPQTVEDSKIFLKSLIPESVADSLLAAYPNVVNDVADGKLDTIDFSKVKGVREKTWKKIKDKIIDNYLISDIITLLKPLGVTFTMIKNLLTNEPNPGLLKQKIENNPYYLCSMKGFGFKKVDKLALKLKPELLESRERCIAFISYYLTEIGENEGHTWCSVDILKAAVEDSAPECIDVFDGVLENNSFLHQYENRIGLKLYYNLEMKILSIIQERLNKPSPVPIENDEIEAGIAKAEQEQGFSYTDEQKAIIRSILTQSISFVTGKAGTGKSSILRGIIRAYSLANHNISACALSAMAAQRITEATDYPAMTIHRTLGCHGPNKFDYNKDCKLISPVVLMDEASMVNVQIFLAWLEAIDDNTKIIICGDYKQLPPIGFGNIFSDLIHCLPKENINELTKVMRQAEKSGILTDANLIRDNKNPITEVITSKKLVHGELQDMYYMFRDTRDSLHQLALKMFFSAVESDGVDNVGIAVPRREGCLNSAYELNKDIAEVLLKDEKKSISFGEKEFKLGCKVVQTVNDYDRNVFNGEIGYITFIGEDMSGKKPVTYCEVTYQSFGPKVEKDVGLVFDEDNNIVYEKQDKVIRYEGSELTDLDMAYALTTHKMQGSSRKTVICVIDNTHYKLLDNCMLYTMLTRAKKRCLLCAEPQAFYKCLNTSNNARNTWLSTIKRKGK